MSPTEILEQLGALGVAARTEGPKLVLRPGSKVPPDLLAAVRGAKADIVKELERRALERRVETQDWMLSEWRRTSMPTWRRILSEARAAGGATRAEYAKTQLQAMGEPTEEGEG